MCPIRSVALLLSLSFAVLPASADAQQLAIQQPVVGMTAVNTTVIVPNRGQIQLGGASRAQSSRQQSGFGLRGSSLGLSRSSTSVSASVTIIDLHEMDEAILNSVPSPPSDRPSRNFVREVAPRLIEQSPQDKAAHFERLALRAASEGRTGVAKLHWAMAEKYNTLAMKTSRTR